MTYADSENTGRFGSDKLEMLIDDYTQLLNENRILQTEINRLNQIIKKLKENSHANN